MAGVWNTTHEAHNRFSSISVQVYSIFFQQKISFPIDWLVLLVESNDKVSTKDIPFIYLRILEAKRKRRKKKTKKGKKKYDKMDNFG